MIFQFGPYKGKTPLQAYSAGGEAWLVRLVQNIKDEGDPIRKIVKKTLEVVNSKGAPLNYRW